MIFVASAFRYLDAPVIRLTGVDIPTPYAFNLEPMSFPTVDKIVNSIK
jgi:pyruvate dehydrogenase E1 component beta subunit